jgi:thymidine phosphorylase
MIAPARIIQAVIDGTAAPDDLRAFAQGLADGSVSDAQAGAFAMAVKLRGLPPEARTALTEGMRDSGDVLRWDLPAPAVDKHSTGGVGDCISLALAPALAACGVFVPMVSGRGLGHTGGTLDKLEAIPGYAVEHPEDRFRAIVAQVGCAIVGASGRIAPADKRLYAIRDVTASVESVDLITASILSKKLAAGLDVLVLDVKTGSGAFLPGAEETRALAHALVDTANGAGCRTSALITDMNAPLCGVAGNALEVAEVMRTLVGQARNADLWALTCALGAEALVLAGVVADTAAGTARIEAALQSGAAAERFGRMIAAQGGPADFLETWARHLPEAPVVIDVFPETAGRIAGIDTRAVGLAVVGLGGGRRRDGDRIDPRVGLTGLARTGDQVGPDRPLGRVHAADAAAAEAAAKALRRAYRLGPDARAVPSLVHERIG